MPGTFPALNTAAIAQYPFERAARWAVEANTFLDFSRQAYRDTAGVLQSWTIALELLDASEIAVLKAFFERQQGSAGTFTFVDPVDGSTHPNCSFAADVFSQQQVEETNNKTKITVYEHA